MQENMGPTQQKVALGIGSAAAAAAIFAPLEYKWKGLLTALAFSGIFSGMTGYSLFNRMMGVRRR